MSVQSLDVEETVERVNIAKEGTQLALTLKGLGSTSRREKLGKDWEAAMWLAKSLAQEEVQWRKNLSQMVTAEH